MLAAAGIKATAFSQQIILYNNYTGQSRSDQIFNGRADGRIRFDFVIEAGKRFSLEFTHLGQMDSLKNINELLATVWKDIQTVGDSMDKPLVNRRIDYVLGLRDQRLRFQEFQPKGESFVINSSDITQLKLEQDTVRITGFTTGRGYTVYGQENNQGSPYYITLLLNSVTELEGLSKDGRLQSAIDLMKSDVPLRTRSTKFRYFSRYYALYNVTSQRRVSPVPSKRVRSERNQTVIPYAQVGVQYIRGAWAPSAGLGLGINSRVGRSVTKDYRLLWEPYFFFGRDGENKLVSSRNDFVTFRYRVESKFTAPARTVEFVQNFSVGYLLGRRGNGFEKYTVKVGLPGLQTKNLLLEPEFVFNKLLKNFSPSVKLILDLE